jgi:hypothetical protein
MYPELKLSSELNVERGKEEIPVIFHNKTAYSSLVLQFLGDTVGGANLNRNTDVHMSVTGASRERLQGVDLRQAVDRDLHKIQFRNGSKYYVITETVLADSINFRITRTSVANLGGVAKIRQIVTAAPCLTLTDSAGTSLVMRFSHPMRVFYKAQLISPQGLGLEGRDAAADLVPVEDVLDIKGDTSEVKRIGPCGPKKAS